MTSAEKPAAEPRIVRPANQRGVARLAAVQALYQMDVGGASLVEVVAEFENFRLGKELDGAQYRDADPAFFRDLVGGVVERQRDLDPAIHTSLTPDWPLTRIDVTLRAILRCGAYELAGRKDVPARVVISEYVDVARAFFESGDEPRMVNGVLDTIARRVRPAEFDGPKKRPETEKRP
ncbi:transcription antitermination factor NusB [Prosthecomicrobium pneumaticum]|uniref:Transcription antitermination protein NusB n=1 Tax=Prosthecomicrobium pneumaticum TaxID=81895 RepID=A0A7W9FQ77_9HYPH|nr:transcription antitermination factor NusB [Prosthecomicrobium pneumaticum]MBB5754756.1 N utilization substance protein B [Prosthecomicrobium pneumaticum]